MRLSRPLIAAAGVVLAGIAVAGVGAGATFTTSASSSQKVTAGTLSVSLSANGATCTNVDASGCHALTLPDVGPVGSTFETPPTTVYVKNTGNIPAIFDAFQMSATTDGTAASSALFNEMNVCIKSTDPSGTWVEGNGPLSTATALNPTVKENPVEVAPGKTVTYSVNFYAGQDSRCGTAYSDGAHTKDAWAAAIGHGYVTPASLTNAAQGGSVIPTLTFSFTG
jgi:hypothetical protein